RFASSTFVSSTSLSSSLRMPQPRTPGPGSRQMVAPTPATLEAGRSEKAHQSISSCDRADSKEVT
ncbi:hypothetical protein JOQ06_017975, partial [Pogonophryne albipinna]